MQRTEVQPLLDRLADFICAHRGEVTQLWIDSVHRNPDIHPAEHLTFRELVDHLPQLFDDLANRLRRVGAKSTGATAEHSHKHGSHRWRQGYALGQLLREIGIIRRTIFLDCLAKFEEENADLTDDVRREAKEIIHRFFSDMTVESAEQFVQDQQRTIRRVNAELEETVQQLNEANRQMKEVGESRLLLLRTISHDLGNSLNAISTAANVLQEEGDDAVRHKMLLVLHRNIADMGALLQQLLSYSSLIEGRARPLLQPFEARLLFDDLVSTYAPLAQAKGLALEGECDPTLGVVVSDRVKVAQIATNLLSNAIKYGKSEGTDEGVIRFEFRTVNIERWRIVVSDQGLGIAASDLDRIFDEFYRVSPSGGVHGTGLGLAIVKGLVEVLDGTITVQSELGRGSRFEVMLPKV